MKWLHGGALPLDSESDREKRRDRNRVKKKQEEEAMNWTIG